MASEASITMNPLLSRIHHTEGQPRLVWRTTYDNRETAEAMAALVSRLEQRGVEPTRVTVVRVKSAANAAFAERLFARLEFNGTSAMANGKLYQEISYDEGDDLTAIAQEVAAFHPSFVLFSADSEIVSKIDAAWPTKVGQKPIYVSDSTIDEPLVDFVASSQERRHRVYGFTSVSSTLPNARFVQHYNETFTPPISRTWSPNSSYDAFYLVGYGSIALGSTPASGPLLARAMSRLQGHGASVEVGPTGLLGGYDDLASGKDINLEGATGGKGFDLRTGESAVPLAVLCLDIDATGKAKGSIESGLVYDGQSGRLVNEAHCE